MWPRSMLSTRANHVNHLANIMAEAAVIEAPVTNGMESVVVAPRPVGL